MKYRDLVKLSFAIIIIIVLIYFLKNLLINETYSSMSDEAVAVFKTDRIKGEVLVINYRDGVKLKANFTELPPGKHGFHIHKAGDLRGEGCHGLCEHYDIGKNTHGGSPEHGGQRHTGDLGNIELKDEKF